MWGRPYTAMTPPDYDDLCARLRELYVQHGTNYVQAAAEAIESLREQVAAKDKALLEWENTVQEDVYARALLKRAEKAEADNAALQAKLDALMFEYCPVEMTEEQRANWTKHQAAALLAEKKKK